MRHVRSSFSHMEGRGDASARLPVCTVCHAAYGGPGAFAQSELAYPGTKVPRWQEVRRRPLCLRKSVASFGAVFHLD
jgi:hypothetical protein